MFSLRPFQWMLHTLYTYQVCKKYEDVKIIWLWLLYLCLLWLCFVWQTYLLKVRADVQLQFTGSFLSHVCNRMHALHLRKTTTLALFFRFHFEQRKFIKKKKQVWMHFFAVASSNSDIEFSICSREISQEHVPHQHFAKMPKIVRTLITIQFVLNHWKLLTWIECQNLYETRKKNDQLNNAYLCVCVCECCFCCRANYFKPI